MPKQAAFHVMDDPPLLASRWRRSGQLLLRLAALLVAGAVSLACGTTLPTKEPVRLTLATSSSALPLADDLARSYRAAFPHIMVDVLALANEAAAAQAVLASRADAALVAGPAPAPAGLAASHVATDALAIVVHPDRPLDNLTGEQIPEIFSGRLRTWDELGAGDDAIQIVTREPEAGPRLALIEAFLGARPLTATAIVLPDDRQILARVASDPQAIAALPAGWLDAQVQAVAIDGRDPEWVARQWPGYPAELPIHLLTPITPAPEIAVLRDWLLSPSGQR
ncbi:MAG TPA: substrate-binding domain-containing protein, partial [Anaerolineae bacterium]|nr:substrate-binding domain-containing protein [Anaerolineae bacterium]